MTKTDLMVTLQEDVIERWNALTRSLERIEGSDEAKRYGPQYVQAQKVDAASRWKTEVLGWWEATAAQVLARVRQQESEAYDGAVARIRAGLPPDAGNPKQIPDDERRHRELMNTLAFGLVALPLAEKASTEELCDTLKGYEEAARKSEEFDFASFSLDARLLPAVLKSRARAGDDRAGLILAEQPVAKIEAALLRRFGIGIESSVEIRDMEEVRAAIEKDDPANLLRSAGEVIQRLERGLARQRNAEKAPPYRPEIAPAPPMPPPTPPGTMPPALRRALGLSG